jgi:hypothetical protein
MNTQCTTNGVRWISSGMNTRRLWSGVACHYRVNWLPSILLGMVG